MGSCYWGSSHAEILVELIPIIKNNIDFDAFTLAKMKVIFDNWYKSVFWKKLI